MEIAVVFTALFALARPTFTAPRMRTVPPKKRENSFHEPFGAPVQHTAPRPVADCPKWGGGWYEPPFQAPNPPPQGGVGLSCQAIEGVAGASPKGHSAPASRKGHRGGLHGTDMGTKTPQNCTRYFWDQRVETGLNNGHLPPLFDENKLQIYLCQKTAQIKAPDARAPRPAPGGGGQRLT